MIERGTTSEEDFDEDEENQSEDDSNMSGNSKGSPEKSKTRKSFTMGKLGDLSGNNGLGMSGKQG